MEDPNSHQVVESGGGSQNPLPEKRRPEGGIEQQSKELRQWAKAAEFPNPIQWGAVEAEILARPLPPSNELEPVRGIQIPGARVLYVLFAFMVSAPYIGLAVLAAHFFSAGQTLGESMSFAMTVIAIVAICIQISIFIRCQETKRRAKWDLPLAGSTAVVTFMSYLLLTAVEYEVMESWYSLSSKWFMLAAALVSVGTFLGILVTSKPQLRLPKVDRKSLTPSDQYYLGLRAVVLETLQQRGLVNSWDLSDMVEMPLGTWRQLDDVNALAGNDRI